MSRSWAFLIGSIVSFGSASVALAPASGGEPSWDVSVVDSAGDVGRHTSLAVLPSGEPAISYSGFSPDGVLKYAWYDGGAWQTTLVDNVAGQATSLALDARGQPAISYYGGALPPHLMFFWSTALWQRTAVDVVGGADGVQ